MGKQWGVRLYLFSVIIFFVAAAETCLCTRNVTMGCFEEERLALLKFKHSLTDDYNTLSSWVGSDCCRWFGLQCDGATGHVVSLHLRGNARVVRDDDDVHFADDFFDARSSDYDFFDAHFLSGGEVISALAELRHLNFLDLSGNDFQRSHIPDFIGSLKHLRYLNLSYASFSGIIPHHLGNLTNLNILDLSSNSWLMADDMVWVSGLSSLKHLDLRMVGVSQAQNLDKLLYMTPSLVELHLSDCEFLNPLLDPPRLNSSGMLPNIKHLDISCDFLRGSFPYFLQNMTSLVFLDLSKYDLSQPLSFENLVNMVPSLLELRLSDCWLHDTHLSPTHVNFSTLANIQHLDLSWNSIGGQFPALFMNMSSLRSLDLSGNLLNSSIPGMSSLFELDLSYNLFDHIEHVGIWNQCHLKWLSISNNNFRDEMIALPTNVTECSKYNLEMLDLTECQFKGSIPESLGRFAFLRELHLGNNKLTGPMPEFLGKLNSLEVLSLPSNHLTGFIRPSLGNLIGLEILDLNSNQLEGPIPVSLGNLTSLKIFRLDSNKFKGPIPVSLGKLIALEILDLSSNQLTGAIPTSIGRLSSLQKLSLSSNLLNGMIPASMGKLTNLQFLDVSKNSLEGLVFETHFANLSMLRYLDATSNLNLAFNISREWIPPFQLRTIRMGSCKIAAELPRWLRTQKKLEELVLSNAGISGHLPTWLRKMPIVRILDLSHNQLTGSLTNLPCGKFFDGIRYAYDAGILLLKNNLFNGSIPKSLCRWTHLILLDLSENRLSGNIPSCLRHLTYLRAMAFSSNGLSGVIPSSLCNRSSSLQWLNLNNNSFSGKLPIALENCYDLRVLDLGENDLSGSLPKWIGESLIHLVVLRLHKNSFTGIIPRSLCHESNLQILDIAYNNITGVVPRCFKELNGMVVGSGEYLYIDTSNSYPNVVQVLKGVDLEYTRTLGLVFNMDLSSNKLVGEIPEELTMLSKLVGLNLSHNHLIGGIPDSIGNMKSLNSLDFSHNELTGVIPPSMAALNFLSHLNLSYNNLSGRIPTGNQLQVLNDPSIYVGNRELYGAPLPKNCSNHEGPTTNGTDKDKGSDEPKKIWFYFDIMSGFVTGFWGVIGVLLFKKQWRHALFRFVEVTMDEIHVAVAVRVAKMKRGREAT